MSDTVYVKKTDGGEELFSREKLRQSLQNSGASAILANEIADAVEKKIKNRVTTDEIYEIAFGLLARHERKTAMRYSLKRSFFSIGPTGFPFEKYIAKVLEKKNYKTETGVILDGECISHEIDVIAYDEDDFILFEVKFHNELKTITDTKVALYVKARFDDLRNKTFKIAGKSRKMTNGILLTNTRFTENAEKYAKCTGLSLISWDYPEKGNLYDMIEGTGIYPLTCILSLSNKDKAKLFRNNILNCEDLGSHIDLLRKMEIPDAKINRVIEEVREICSALDVKVKF